MNQLAANPGTDTLERARFFPRQIVLPGDLAQDQAFFLTRSRRDNRIFRGYGVERGLDVQKLDAVTAQQLIAKTILPKDNKPETTWIAVTPGYALTPGGDALYLPNQVYLNTRAELNNALVTADFACGNQSAQEKNRGTEKLYLVAQPCVMEVSPAHAAGNRCGDSPDQFEFTRLRDVIRFRLVPEGAIVPPYGDASEEEENILAGKTKRSFVCLGSVTFAADGLAVDTSDKRDLLKKTPAPAPVPPAPTPPIPNGGITPTPVPPKPQPTDLGKFFEKILPFAVPVLVGIGLLGILKLLKVI